MNADSEKESVPHFVVAGFLCRYILLEKPFCIDSTVYLSSGVSVYLNYSPMIAQVPNHHHHPKCSRPYLLYLTSQSIL